MSGFPIASPPAQAAPSHFSAPYPQLAQQESEENFRLNFQGKPQLEDVHLHSNYVHFQNTKDMIFC